MTRTIALCFDYDGSAFVGSQWQTEGLSVQAELEAGWTKLTGEQARWIFAGRTDAGVHALAQVAHVKTNTTHSLETIVRAINALTNRSLSVHEAWEVPATFHARFSARERAYRYLIHTSPTSVALLQGRVTHVPDQLDQAAMSAALEFLLGEHDFAAFAGAGQEGSTIRTCTVARLEHDNVLGQPCLALILQANAFLRHMVRNITGTLLEIGKGRMYGEAISTILASRNRRQAGPTARPEGLYLEWIAYDPAVAPFSTSQRWDQKTFWRAYHQKD